MILSSFQQSSLNEQTILNVLQPLIDIGVREFSVCPGGRNAPFIAALAKEPKLKIYYWHDERSAAFFALGRSKLTKSPVAIITTSGTAAGELLPAAMEGYYSGVPIIFVTADRPRHYRGSGAPQTAEQVGLYGQYVYFSLDIAEQEKVCLKAWNQKGPAHLNVCLEEPLNQTFEDFESLKFPPLNHTPDHFSDLNISCLEDFIDSVNYPFVIVSTLPEEAKEAVIRFLLELGAPVFLEAVSGLREHPKLQHLRVIRQENLWEEADKHDYPIDSVLRIGGVPTFRLWRDLEEKRNRVKVFSISEQPFPGLSNGQVLHTSLKTFFQEYPKSAKEYPCRKWLKADYLYSLKLDLLFEEEPLSEGALLNNLSSLIPAFSRVYLGNSLPIREWDAFAINSFRNWEIFASRGLNGIDGQISTFLGVCSKETSNWAIIGDLTALYDLSALWITQQLKEIPFQLVIINNGGGKIFSRLFTNPQIQNPHSFSFENFAALWKIPYERWTTIPHYLTPVHQRIIEIVPDELGTQRFWEKMP